ncbi:hypothetical protein CFT9_01820 [Pseudomonas sp. CFT9]|nr:hypothetical protein CFT9_01820 [Pseudomonas sp. CFT9]
MEDVGVVTGAVGVDGEVIVDMGLLVINGLKAR